MATLTDYQDKGVPEPERFFESNRGLSMNEYRSKIVETYGSPGRDKNMEKMVNAAVLLYAVTNKNRNWF